MVIGSFWVSCFWFLCFQNNYQNPEQETRNKKQETRNKKQETRNKKQETHFLTPKNGHRAGCGIHQRRILRRGSPAFVILPE